MIRLNIITISFISVVIALYLFVSCDKNRIYEKNIEIEKNLWDLNEPLLFLFRINDTAQHYNVYINVRNAGFYGFSNLYLFVNVHLPGGQLQRDTVECILAAPDGRWLGDGLGDIWDNRVLFKKDVKFPLTGEYRIELIQAMRVNPLPGIMDAGIRIEKAR